MERHRSNKTSLSTAEVFEVEADESWEIPREHLVLQDVIGEGAFGTVMKGTVYGLTGKPSQYTVAVKTLRGTYMNTCVITNQSYHRNTALRTKWE